VSRWWLLIIALVPAPLSAGHTLSARNRAILDHWLQKHPHFTLARPEDCSCPDDIAAMKNGDGGAWAPVPDYNPYVATGDFNSDGAEDLAVVVRDRTLQAKAFRFLIFNGPLRSGIPPAFEERDLEARREGLFFGPPRPKPYRLLIGGFETEAAILVPKGKSYVLTYEEP